MGESIPLSEPQFPRQYSVTVIVSLEEVKVPARWRYLIYIQSPNQFAAPSSPDGFLMWPFPKPSFVCRVRCKLSLKLMLVHCPLSLASHLLLSLSCEMPGLQLPERPSLRSALQPALPIALARLVLSWEPSFTAALSFPVVSALLSRTVSHQPPHLWPHSVVLSFLLGSLSLESWAVIFSSLWEPSRMAGLEKLFQDVCWTVLHTAMLLPESCATILPPESYIPTVLTGSYATTLPSESYVTTWLLHYYITTKSSITALLPESCIRNYYLNPPYHTLLPEFSITTLLPKSCITTLLPDSYMTTGHYK